MAKQKKEKPKKIAYVVAGRSLLTKIGCANAGAKVTPSMIAAGNPESQLTIWYRLIREDGVLELPKTLKTELKKAAEENEQISLEAFFNPVDGEEEPGEEEPGEEEPGEEVPDEEVPDEEVPDEEVPDEEVPGEEKPPAADKSKRKRGAQRK
jgi:hypothetical protein